MVNKKCKKVLVTGGSNGIGAEAVKSFIAHGATVAFLYNKSQNEAFELSRETGALAVRCNVNSPESVKNAMEVVKEYFQDEIDVLVNNAAIMDMNLGSAYYCIKEIMPIMIKAKHGSVINVASYRSGQGKAAYTAITSGISGMTKTIAKEVSSSGVRVNCLETGSNESAASESIIALIEFLASNKAEFITGQVIDVSGGLNI